MICPGLASHLVADEQTFGSRFLQASQAQALHERLYGGEGRTESPACGGACSAGAARSNSPVELHAESSVRREAAANTHPSIPSAALRRPASNLERLVGRYAGLIPLVLQGAEWTAVHRDCRRMACSRLMGLFSRRQEGGLCMGPVVRCWDGGGQSDPGDLTPPCQMNNVARATLERINPWLGVLPISDCQFSLSLAFPTVIKRSKARGTGGRKSQSRQGPR